VAAVMGEGFVHCEPNGREFIRCGCP